MKPRTRKPILTRLRGLYAENAETGCWDWTGMKNTKGYGIIVIEGRHRVAHRVAYKELVGPVPDELQMDHLCRNRACVNPDHLEPVTPRENVLRGIGYAAVNRRKTHCDQGHEFTFENTYTQYDGQHRRCRTCQRAHDHKRRAKDVA